MASKRYYNLLTIADTYSKPPSDWFDDLTDYEKYCFDEASFVVLQRMKNGEQMKVKKSYASFSDYYKNIEKG